MITHSFLGVGKVSGVVIVGEDRKVQWRYNGQKAGFRHFQILTNNGKLINKNTWK